MVVAAGTTHRQAEEDRPDAAGHLVEKFVADFERIDISGHLVNRTTTVEPGRDEQMRRVAPAAGQQIARQLLGEEAIVWLVGIESANDPVAVAPGLGPLGVAFIAVGLGVAGHVEPVLCPALAVVRRGK